jgi:hypothetical protein
MAKQKKPAGAVLRKLPAVDTLLKEPDLESYATELGRAVVVNSIRRVIEEVRELLMSQALVDTDEDSIRQKIIADVKISLKTISRRHYRKVVNATGLFCTPLSGELFSPLRHSTTFRMNCRAILCYRLMKNPANARNGMVI